MFLSGGEARARPILYSGVSKIFWCKRVLKELDTNSPVAELAFRVLPLQALSWLTLLAWGTGLQGISLLSLSFAACVLNEGRKMLRHPVAHVRKERYEQRQK